MPPSFTITTGGGPTGSVLEPPVPAATPEPAVGGLPAAAVEPPTAPRLWLTCGGALVQLNPHAAASTRASQRTREFRFHMTPDSADRSKVRDASRERVLGAAW